LSIKSDVTTDPKKISYQLKKEYQEVKIIWDKSRFGWNVEKSLAMAKDSIWEKIRALHSPTCLCRLYIDYRESTESLHGLEWEYK